MQSLALPLPLRRWRPLPIRSDSGTGNDRQAGMFEFPAKILLRMRMLEYSRLKGHHNDNQSPAIILLYRLIDDHNIDLWSVT